jgi:FdrA protein
MSAPIVNRVRHGFYLDSVALMRYSRTLAERDGVEEAALMMGTPANRQIMADAGLLDATGENAEGGDLVIAVRGTAAEAAADEAEHLLDSPAQARGDGEAWRPRSIRAAVKAHPRSNLALISVPGDFAAAEARQALRLGLHAMIFSDNVSLDEEAALKREARDLGRLVMGPDCGTAIIGGLPLGFANAVPTGDIGIIGASGTGIQEVSCLIARGGRGISHAIGVGGNDLKEAVGGITTLMALDALDADPGTAHIVLISKPPAEGVAARVVERIAASKKPFTLCLIGAGDMELPDNATLAPTLKAAAEGALGGTPIGDSASGAVPAAPQPRVRGLFSGGTLCAEAQIIFAAAGEAVGSNAPIPGVPNLEAAGDGHPMIDLGADEYTRGRPHPMIDPAVREEALAEALADPAVGVILLDVVIGYGAHPDPAGGLAAVVEAHRPTDGPVVVASVTGTAGDPQDLPAQVARLEAAGICVAPSNADAARLALTSIRGGGSP